MGGGAGSGQKLLVDETDGGGRRRFELRCDSVWRRLRFFVSKELFTKPSTPWLLCLSWEGVRWVAVSAVPLFGATWEKISAETCHITKVTISVWRDCAGNSFTLAQAWARALNCWFDSIFKQGFDGFLVLYWYPWLQKNESSSFRQSLWASRVLWQCNPQYQIHNLYVCSIDPRITV